MTKRVLIVMTTALTLDGISAMVMNYFKHFSQRDFTYEFTAWNEVSDDIRKEIENRNGIFHKLPHRTRQPIHYYYALKKLIKENAYSIVHAHGNSSTLYIEMLAAKKAGVPVRIAHSHNSTCLHMTIHKLLKRPFMYSYTHAFACSKKAGDWLFNGQYDLINNGIELEKYSFRKEIREKVRTEIRLKGKKVIGHVGNFSYAKNHDYLINIFASLVKRDKSYFLMLVGEGGLMNSIRHKIQALGLSDNVRMFGKRKDVPDLMQAMDLFMMPSHFEGLPFVLIEAQAAGLPCVISKNITEEVNITGLLEYVSLEQPPEYWAGVIEDLPNLDRGMASAKACEDLRNAGYDIKLEAKRLEKRYLSMLEELE